MQKLYLNNLTKKKPENRARELLGYKSVNG